MHTLPKPYLSYSQFRLWKDNKDAYRRRYYFNEPSWDTPETLFGRQIAKKLEQGDTVLSTVPRYDTPEHKIELEVGGIPLLGYLDSFHSTEHKILEYKTGHHSKDGKAPWDRVKVQKHEQLDFYSLLVEEKYGHVDPLTMLVWLETVKKQKTVEFEGHILTGKDYTIELTGRVECFKRKVFSYERKNIKKEIISVAQEIAADYAIERVHTQTHS